ncbi:entericidin A/B family lipoprotein [Parasphingopyxis lamellibrachiae]|uniref:Entericidin EcnA/B family protein n=1 Tax=Parasphingopyxis lamellibrachiae TaxID=680125 RepID=A0A3D9FGV6_9SPHN|nr:entericidin A/B family lipoprotein [Parasphingopyxis lamellibrachiae]RED16888.1 entericidin EcnA/B family protein [Parasphingopyxis lamellibrachiae]
MKSFAILAAALVFSATAGCNTIQGIGEDVESVGETVAREAQ